MLGLGYWQSLSWLHWRSLWNVFFKPTMACSVLKCGFDRWQPLKWDTAYVCAPKSPTLLCAHALILAILFLFFSKSFILEGRKMNTSAVSFDYLLRVSRAHVYLCIWKPITVDDTSHFHCLLLLTFVPPHPPWPASPSLGSLISFSTNPFLKSFIIG